MLAPTWEVGEPFSSQAEQGLDAAITAPREGPSSSFLLKDLVPEDLEIMHLGEHEFFQVCGLSCTSNRYDLAAHPAARTLG